MAIRAISKIPTPFADALAMAKRSASQKQRQRNGALAEELVQRDLIRRGFRLVEKVEVPFRVNKRTGSISARRKVSGDFRAVEPGTGRSLLVEVKHHAERLPYAAFRPHQLVALEEHASAGGISEVAWVDSSIPAFCTLHALRVIAWADLKRIGFASGKSIEWIDGKAEIYRPTRTPKTKN